MNSRPVILHTGGTDPSGGAGLAADLKTTAALGGHGCIAVTAVTSQNSGGVESWMPIPPDMIAAQMNATCDDGIPQGVKTGMLGSSAAVSAISEVIRNRLKGVPLVLDPVMVAGSGDGLAETSLEKSLTEHLLPLATLVTPNLDEAEAFTGMRVRNRGQMEEAALRIREMGAESVLLKGGHLQGEPWDVLLTERGFKWFPGKRIVPGKVHGTGCTLASACATLLGAGYSVEEAVNNSLLYLRGAITASFSRKLGILPGHFPGMGPLPGRNNRTAFYETPRFCPACSGELAAAKPHPICPGCGLVFYRNPLPAVILVLRDGNRVLLAKRAFPPAAGEWCLPGGFIDLGESPLRAAERELTEETSLIPERMILTGSLSDLTEYGSVVLFVYEATGWRGTPSPADDVAELRWVELDRVPALAFSAHDRVIESIRRKD